MKRTSPFVSEAVLIEKLNRRDEQAFHWLYDQYSPALFGVIRKIVHDDEQARDLLQDAFIKIWNNLDSYDASKGRLFTWLLNVARNTAIDNLRSAKASSRPNPANAIHTDAENVYIVDRQHQTEPENIDHIGMREVVDKLRPERKMLIDLVYFNGYTHEEAAEVLNLPLGTVKTRVRSALQELKQFFSR
ncbi:sigma-70 family RNA polymerase sigma factor [Rudanella paleaurantiibacter]|uniref:Sigma-70 family RNA polymerase sigma factor n=1 Tax=Rudanella paleaurantiibacter TaxID=2614655 RepID=A0A7J5U038_9BACT|nr:sigma-70 family RNA polymerase sigma factor [Rudanella paleaurantiibacter]KAB7731112.1 sigma-70 family RNA polymerase sigma factor [Rudanella paleaurantiibacter]